MKYFKSIFLSLSVLSFFLILSPSVLARDYYVAPNGNNNNNGSQSSPWKTIQYAVTRKNVVQPGDTINIMPGTYNEQVVMNGGVGTREGQPEASSVEGANGNRITIKGYNPNNPPVVINGKTADYQWVVFDVSNITFQNIQFGKPSGIGIREWERFAQSSGGTAQNPTDTEKEKWDEITRIETQRGESIRYYYSGFKVLAEDEAVNNITIDGFKFYNQYVPDTYRPGLGGYFGLVVTATNKDFPMTNVKIINTYMENIDTKDILGFGHECMRVNGAIRKTVVENNTIVECEALAIDVLGQNVPNTGAYINAQPEKTVVRNNTIIRMSKNPKKNAAPTSIYGDRAGERLLVESNYTEGFSSIFKANIEPDGNGEYDDMSFGKIIVRNNIGRGDASTRGQDRGIILGHGNSTTPANNINQFVDQIAVNHNVVFTKKPNSGNRPALSFYSATNISSKNNIFYVFNGGLIQESQAGHAAAFNAGPRESNGNIWYAKDGSPSWQWQPGVAYNSFANYKTGSGQDGASMYANPNFVNFPSSAQVKNSTAKRPGNYNLTSGSTGYENGIALTKTTQAGTNSKTVKVSDAKYFYDGWGIEGEVGDRIKIGGQEARVTNVNYDTNTLTIDRSLSWGNNAPVNYYYEGSSPNIGLLPNSFYDGSNVTPIPTPTDDPNATPTPTPNGNNSPTPYVPVNLIQNGDFSDGTSNWYVSSSNTTGSTDLSVNNDGEAVVDVVANSTSYNQLYQFGIAVEQGKQYILRFKAKADTDGKSIKAGLIKHNGPPYTNLFGIDDGSGNITASNMDVALTTTMEEYSQVFTATQTESNARFRILFNDTGVYTIDDVVIEEYVEATPTPVDDCPLFPQGDATCDGVVDSADYSCWRTQFITVLNGGTPSAANDCRVSDFNEDNTVNLLDFVLWKRG